MLRIAAIPEEASQAPAMDVRTFHDLNVVLRKLNDAIQHERYTDGRMGMVPPERMSAALALVRDAEATIRALTGERSDNA